MAGLIVALDDKVDRVEETLEELEQGQGEPAAAADALEERLDRLESRLDKLIGSRASWSSCSQPKTVWPKAAGKPAEETKAIAHPVRTENQSSIDDER